MEGTSEIRSCGHSLDWSGTPGHSHLSTELKPGHGDKRHELDDGVCDFSQRVFSPGDAFTRTMVKGDSP